MAKSFETWRYKGVVSFDQQVNHGAREIFYSFIHRFVTEVTATGTVQGDAAAMSGGGVHVVNGGGADTGVILPSGTAISGLIFDIYNETASNKKIWPAVGQKILKADGTDLGLNNAYDLAANEWISLITRAADGSTWLEMSSTPGGISLPATGTLLDLSAESLDGVQLEGGGTPAAIRSSGGAVVLVDNGSGGDVANFEVDANIIRFRPAVFSFMQIGTAGNVYYALSPTEMQYDSMPLKGARAGRPLQLGALSNGGVGYSNHSLTNTDAAVGDNFEVEGDTYLGDANEYFHFRDNAGDPTMDIYRGGALAGSLNSDASTLYLSSSNGAVDIAGSGQGVIVPRLTGDPGAATNGEIYYNTTTNKFRGYENSAWADLI